MLAYKEFRRRCELALEKLDEENIFYIYRTDTNAVLARGIKGYETAKEKASQIRKSSNLKFDQISFKMERKPATQLGVSRDGKTFTNSRSERYPIKYSRNYSPSKRGRFQSYTDKDGNQHDLS
jgi:hypothetical protein